jgi:HAUS augmin-like complex subunit 1
MSHLSPPATPLLSPTKARREAAQAKDWAHISSWLAKKYSPHPVPRFERNAETLAALLELVAVNEAADREVELIQRAEGEELRRYGEFFQTGGGPCQDMLEVLEDSLDTQGKDALNDLAEATILLGTLSSDSVVMGERIVELSCSKFEMEEQLRRVSDLQSQLEGEAKMMTTDIENIESRVDELKQENMQQRTAQLHRETKQFTTKMEQYSERVATLERFDVSSPSITEVKTQEQRVKKIQARVEALKRQVAEFHGLPPDLEAARGEYQRAQGELQKLKRQREELFQKMMVNS